MPNLMCTVLLCTGNVRDPKISVTQNGKQVKQSPRVARLSCLDLVDVQEVDGAGVRRNPFIQRSCEHQAIGMYVDFS